MIADTSLTAYNSIKTKLGTRQLAVYEAIGDMGLATNEDISEYLGWAINCVCGRSNELRRLGMIGFEKYKISRYGRKAQAWSIRDTSDNKLMDLILEAEDERIR